MPYYVRAISNYIDYSVVGAVSLGINRYDRRNDNNGCAADINNTKYVLRFLPIE